MLFIPLFALNIIHAFHQAYTSYLIIHNTFYDMARLTDLQYAIVWFWYGGFLISQSYCQKLIIS